MNGRVMPPCPGVLPPLCLNTEESSRWKPPGGWPTAVCRPAGTQTHRLLTLANIIRNRNSSGVWSALPAGLTTPFPLTEGSPAHSFVTSDTKKACPTEYVTGADAGHEDTATACAVPRQSPVPSSGPCSAAGHTLAWCPSLVLSGFLTTAPSLPQAGQIRPPCWPWLRHTGAQGQWAG